MLTETGIEFLLSNDEDDGGISGSRTCVSKARGNQPSGGADRADQRDKRVLLTTSVSFNARIVDEARRSFLNRAEHADNKNTLAELCIIDSAIQLLDVSTYDTLLSLLFRMQASDAFEPIEAGKFRETAESNAEMRELVSRVSRLFGADSHRV